MHISYTLRQSQPVDRTWRVNQGTPRGAASRGPSSKWVEPSQHLRSISILVNTYRCKVIPKMPTRTPSASQHAESVFSRVSQSGFQTQTRCRAYQNATASLRHSFAMTASSPRSASAPGGCMGAVMGAPKRRSLPPAVQKQLSVCNQDLLTETRMLLNGFLMQVLCLFFMTTPGMSIRFLQN